MAGADRRQFALFQEVQCSGISNPDCAIASCQHRADTVCRQSFSHGKTDDRQITKAVDALRGGYPQCSLLVLEEAGNGIARQSIGVRKVIGFVAVYPENPAPSGSNPQRAIAVSKDCGNPGVRAWHTGQRDVFPRFIRKVPELKASPRSFETGPQVAIGRYSERHNSEQQSVLLQFFLEKCCRGSRFPPAKPSKSADPEIPGLVYC